MQRRRKTYDYRRPVDPERSVLGDALLRDLVATKAFQRLRRIRFLGGIDYALVKAPNGTRQRYSRYQHSLGVAHLAMMYADIAQLSYHDRRIAYAAALLHDIGHAPFSHSLESVFLEKFGIEHHSATTDVICGRVPIGLEVIDVLRWHQVNIDRLLEIISGSSDDFDSFFSGPINFDTVEGILRSYSYLKFTPTRLMPENVLLAAFQRESNQDKEIVDSFWKTKSFIYLHVISSPVGILADHICQEAMKTNISVFSADDYFIDEAAAFRKLPKLFQVLTSREFLAVAAQILDKDIGYYRREFFIDTKFDFFNRDDSQRYKQRKVALQLKMRLESHSSAVGAITDLFDDDSL